MNIAYRTTQRPPAQTATAVGQGFTAQSTAPIATGTGVPDVHGPHESRGQSVSVLHGTSSAEPTTHRPLAHTATAPGQGFRKQAGWRPPGTGVPGAQGPQASRGQSVSLLQAAKPGEACGTPGTGDVGGGTY